MSKNTNKSTFALFLLILCSSFLTHDESKNSERILSDLNGYLVKSMQEKAYLHCDKPYYVTGDTIWFKAYLINAVNHKAYTLSSNLYVDLIGPSSEIISSRNLKVTEGGASGDFQLQNDLPAGKYVLRAYTNWMRNFDSAFFYHQPVWVATSGTPQSKEAPSARGLTNTKPLATGKPDLQFFPEGGDMISGLPGIVAFKALNENGLPEDVNGRIADQNGNTITTLHTTHRGMGAFLIVPQYENDYVARIAHEGDTLSYTLPSIQPDGYTITVSNNYENDKINVIVRTNTEEGLAGGYLVGHSRGLVFYSAYVREGTKEALFKVRKNLAAPGIATFTFFDQKGRPQVERLSFIGQDSLISQPELKINNPDPGTREKVSFQITSEDTSIANVSVTITNAVVVNRNKHDENILTYLSLSSDLKGHIRDPYYYFDPYNAQKHKELELLLMTHGWRRFTWKEVAGGFQPNHVYEDGFLIQGQLKNFVFRNKPTSGIVQLVSFENGLQMMQTESTEEGYFYFPNQNISDTTSFLIQAKKEKNNKNSFFIELHKNEAPEVVDLNIPEYRYQKPSEEFISKSEELFQILKAYKGRGKTIVLDEIEVREERQEDIFDNAPGNIYGHPDHRIIPDSLPGAGAATDIFQLLMGIPGVMVSGNSVSIRGQGMPLFLLDGMPLNSFDDAGSTAVLQSINVQDIAFIDVLKNMSSTAIYGGRGSNGIIAIYTRRGGSVSTNTNRELPGILSFTHPGYYQAKEFYAPRYSGARKEEIMPDRRITLYWNPDIHLEKGKSEELSFFTYDETATYDIIIEGISGSGMPIYGRHKMMTGL